MRMVPSDPPSEPALAGSAPPVVSRRFEILVVTGILLALLMGALDNFVVVTVLQTNILPSFGAPSGGTFVISGYIIATTVAVPIFGKLSDLWSRRNVFIAGLLIFIGGSALSGLSQNLSELIAFRAVQGFGAGDFFPVGIAIVAVTFPPATRARITGLLSGVFGIATVAGPLLGSAIVSVTTWRWVFYVNLPIGLLGLAIIGLTLGPLRPEVKRPFDIPGAALLVGWVGALMYPLIQVQELLWTWSDPRTLGLLAGATAIAVLFVLWELRAREPLVPLRLLAHRVVAASGGTVFLIGMVFFSLVTLLSFAVGGVLSHGASNSADIVRDVLYALVLPLVVGAVLGGQLVTRVAFRTVVFLGLAISFVGLYFLTRLTASTPTWTLAFGFLPVGGLVLPLIPIGFGVGLTFPVFLLATQNQVPKKDMGEASGLVQFLQSLGGSVGLSILATFQNGRFQALDPSPSPSCTTTMPQLPLCLPFLQAIGTSEITAFDQTFMVMLGMLAVALGFALFLVGRMPKGGDVTPSLSGPG